jgi:flagellar biosynthetic protein FliQ
MSEVLAHAQVLFGAAMQAALLIAMPVVALVACIGVAVGIAQTVVQVQDQNLAFFPKLVAVAWVAAALGPAALALLVELFATIARALPALANA